MSDHVVHWDEVEGYQRTAGDIDAHWYDLGSASGSDRIRIEPGRRSTPAHVHGAEEEIFFVLDGWGLLWQDDAVCEVRAGDAIVHLPGSRGGAKDGLAVLGPVLQHAVDQLRGGDH